MTYPGPVDPETEEELPGEVFEGTLEDGIRQGHGKYIWPGKEEGEIKVGRRQCVFIKTPRGETTRGSFYASKGASFSTPCRKIFIYQKSYEIITRLDTRLGPITALLEPRRLCMPETSHGARRHIMRGTTRITRRVGRDS